MMVLALPAGINDDDIFLRMQDLLAEAMAEGLSVQGALNALSLGAVRLYLRNDIGNPFVRATASVSFVKVGSLVGQSPSLHAEPKQLSLCPCQREPQNKSPG
eukprot:COSAG04_NODE_3544_length_2721_cov_2.400076_3_plen_102_part_00